MCFRWCRKNKPGSDEELECITLEGKAKKILSAFYAHPINVMKLDNQFKIKYILLKNKKISLDIKKRIGINKLDLEQDLTQNEKKEYVCQFIISINTQQLETLIKNIKKTLSRKKYFC